MDHKLDLRIIIELQDELRGGGGGGGGGSGGKGRTGDARDLDNKLCAIHDKYAMECITALHEEFVRPSVNMTQEEINDIVCNMMDTVS